ncbi:MAG: hypothetical protein PHQ60_15720 [Sideroxydans sp.]|nr:hypothetical protein [Sideroxydans sp.]
MPKVVTVTLAGTEYTVTELPSQRNAEWRRLVDEALKGISGVLGKSLAVDNLQGALDAARGLLLESGDTILRLLCAYAEDIAEDRERIEAEAYDSELTEALVEVLSLAYPFGSLLRAAGIGSRGTPTFSSSPGQNGGSGSKAGKSSRKRTRLSS